VAQLLDALMDLVFLIGVAWTLTRSVRSLFGRTEQGFHGAPNSGSRRKAEPIRGRTARDPVCGMFVSTEVSHRLVRGNKTLHFCSQECLDRYEKKAVSA
jgi:YHS domain-containing protein